MPRKRVDPPVNRHGPEGWKGPLVVPGSRLFFTTSLFLTRFLHPLPFSLLPSSMLPSRSSPNDSWSLEYVPWRIGSWPVDCLPLELRS